MNTSIRGNRKHNTNLAITEESLSLMTDEQLKRLFIDLRSNINKNRRKKNSSKDREVDFCYVQRELQLRKGGRKQRQT